MNTTPLAYQLSGHITAEAPITVSYFGMDERLPRTPHGQVFLNGGTLRGPLRKAGLNMLIRELAKAHDKPEDRVFDRAQMYMLGEGIDVSRQVNNEATGTSHDPRAEGFLRQANPFMSLFGRWKLAGYLEVGPLLTSVDNLMTAGQGARHDQFEHDPRLVTYLSEDEQTALMSEMRSARESMVEIEAIRVKIREIRVASRQTDDREAKQAFAKQVRELEAQEKEVRKQREGSDESIKHPLTGYEAIAPGSELQSRLRLIEGSPEILGLLLHCLAEFSHRPRLGGHLANGFGAISAEWEVLQRAPGERRALPIGTVKLDDIGIQLEGDVLEAAWQSFITALPHYDFTLFNRQEARKRWKQG
ncbi:hypothetical protein ELY33_12300 [Vreelandella andesensis]|uniref:Uncharacterized protein n=1 Tax=Vreelandella andesensis TaxID=447567 RepID=A0A433KJM1_9GAMM|nr:hypothetical protein [Halomonas andesensis]RUR29719.1 hypothetical protein ELY33_12300 [Halomonas andesensis]